MRESNLLNHIYSFNAKLASRITIPPGDDMGAIHVDKGDLLVTVDQLVDGVHFELASTSLTKIGRKAITRNLSDVAAMAAVPVGAVVAGCLPRTLGEANANALFDAIRSTAAAYDCPLIGGDIAMWDQGIVLSVTVFAECDGVEPITRAGAKRGDVVFVTGKLGGSLEPIGVPPYVHHLDFEPRLAVARALAADARTRPRCMIDLSDGMATDLARMVQVADCDGGGDVSALIDVTRLPISAGSEQAAKRTGRPAWEHALGDGEDYELCMIVSPDVAETLPATIADVPLTRIGVIEARAGADVMLQLTDGSVEPCRTTGWEHHD